MAGKKEIKLVPTEEQPYEISENWCWVRMRDLYVINPKNSASDDLPASFVPMERIAPGMVSDFTYEVQPWGKAKKGHTQFADGDVAFAKISPCFENRKSMMVNGLENGIGAGTTELIILRQPLVDQAYTFWIVSDDRFIQGGNQTYSGTVGQQRISMDYVREYPVPLAPLAEQKRIVDTIVDLFADLDKAAENAQRIVDTYEQRRAAILADAFAGRLTEQWRDRNHIDIGSWQELSLSDLGILERGRSKHRPRNDERLFGGDYPFIQTGDVAGANVYVTHHTQTLSEFGMAQSRLFPAGTLCITIAANIGDVAILSYDCCFPDSVVGFTPNEKTSSKYVYYMMSVLQKELEANAPATAQKNINLKVLNDVRISTPMREEQDEIVRILDELLGNEQRIKEAAEEMLDKIAMMKKSILADAFRGKLGTNDPADEPATELLRQILA